MTRVTDAYASRGRRPLVVCDFSPPRSGDPAALAPAATLDADFICVAYNPGKAVRADSLAAAAYIKQAYAKDAIFNLATRDMNKIALQAHLLGAQVLGVENVMIVQGDAFTPQERTRVSQVGDFTATGLIEAVKGLNAGVDYRGLRLQAAGDFCIGASADLGRGLEEEAKLARRKLDAGAQFLLTQPVFDMAQRRRFIDRVWGGGAAPDVPVFWGLQVLIAGGIVFSSVPEALRSQLEQGRDGVEIALEVYESFRAQGIDAVYLVPPILRGGARDYEAAARVLSAIRAS